MLKRNASALSTKDYSFDDQQINKISMQATYVIGDVQGCCDQLRELIANIDTVDPNAQLLFAGDLINRGPKSLETLRLVRQLEGRARTVLGNHDLNLLAVAYGVRREHHSDTIADILQAPDREELLDWLRHQALAIEIDNDTILVHAGVLPQWTAAQTLNHAKEIEKILQNGDYIGLLRDMYGNEPALWRDDLVGIDRQRCIINAFTRLRFCDQDGRMDFSIKEGSGQAPAHLMPWFDVPQRQTQDHTILFGHWSMLGLVIRDKLISLDTGCVWGGQLTAIRLSDRHLIQVQSPQQFAPF